MDIVTFAESCHPAKPETCPVELLVAGDRLWRRPDRLEAAGPTPDLTVTAVVPAGAGLTTVSCTRRDADGHVHTLEATLRCGTAVPYRPAAALVPA